MEIFAMSLTENKQTYQLTLRDRTCLVWIAQQYAIRLDQLQRLLYRHTPEVDRYKLKPGREALSLDRTYEIMNKWLALGLIEKEIILHGDKLWIWLTRAGLREVQLDFNYSGVPASSRLSHLYYINQVRLAIEAKRPDDLWKSERQILKEQPALAKGETKPHTPDAILTNMANGKITAIEVEVHAKTDDELEDNLRELAISYKSVWYFTTTTTRRQVEKILETFEPAMYKPFILYNLKEYGHEYGIS
jgi:hypothetical protein